MPKRFIMTAFAQDRMGVVADISKIIFDQKCNLEDTEMTQLEDEFAIMLLFTSKQEGILEQLNKECRRLEKEKGITAFVRQLTEEWSKDSSTFTLHHIHAECVDHAGIIYKMSEFLTSHNINVAKLYSRRRRQAGTGTFIYTVEIDIEVPNEMSLEDLEHELQDLGEEMHLQLQFDDH